MRKFAVSLSDTINCELKIKIVSYPTNNWYECLLLAFPNEIRNINLSEDIDKAKDEIASNGFLFEILEILD